MNDSTIKRHNIEDYRDELIRKGREFYFDNPEVLPGELLDKQIKFLEGLKKDMEICKTELTTTRPDKKEYKKLYKVICRAIKYYNKVKSSSY